MTSRFYADIPSLHDFKDITNPSFYQPAPADWFLVITDVKGSTDAIKAGRYRDVNMLGASCITAVLNAIKHDVDIPYVFGGDGATLLIPPGKKDAVVETLKATQKMSREMFQMELRAGIVPMSVIHEKGGSIGVAKYELSEGNHLAQFRGGGVTLGEKLIKSPESGAAYLLQPDERTPPPDLEGLSCRWEPFKTTQGTMLTLLAMHRSHGPEAAASYREILEKIESILGHDLRAANPVSYDRFKGKWPAPMLLAEIKLNSNWLTFPLKVAHKLIYTFISYLTTNHHMWFFDFDAKKYKTESVLNTDFKKFDDMLRMVVDCTKQQADEIENLLQGLYEKGEIYYGVHRSPEAVMTCLVFAPTKNRHLHFIDGSHGGYAMAAQGLKKQLANRA